MKRRVVLALALGAVLCTTGCLSPRALGRMPSLRASELLSAGPIVQAGRLAKDAAAGLAGVLAIVVSLVSAHKARQGERQWTSLMGEYWTGLAAAAALIAVWGTPLGPDVLIRQTGDHLAVTFAADSSWANYWKLVNESAAAIWTLNEATGHADDSGTPGGAPASASLPVPLGISTAHRLAAERAAGGQRGIELTDDDIGRAVGWMYSRVATLPFLMLNGSAAYVWALLIQSMGAILLAFYSVLGPLAAACVILPGTRGIFWGYLKVLCSLSLWGALFGIMERVCQGVPLALARGITADNAAPGAAGLKAIAERTMAWTVTLAYTNLILFFVYLSVPIAAWMLVNAAGRPFKGVL